MKEFILLTILTAALVVIVLVSSDTRASCAHQMVAGGASWCNVEEE